VIVVRPTPALYPAVARRIVQQSQSDPEQAARKLLANAPAHGIDFSLARVSVLASDVAGLATEAVPVREACLAVPSPGRTAMCFLGEPMKGEEGPDREDERSAVIDALCRALQEERPGKVVLAQALPDPKEAWSVRAFVGAGFVSVGTLSYMRRAPSAVAGERKDPFAGCRVVRLSNLPEGEREGPLLEAMDASYEATLDCPELSGLRETPDILVSHKATGVFDPALWWVVISDQRPRGCVLFSACPGQKSFELVYVGLSPSLRGRGLGKRLVEMGLRECREKHASWGVTCAVDERNVPALGVYGSLGFRGYARRSALVRALGARGGGAAC
jgi:ribosomal protein S18 acetylase RimI-like enzyme